MQPTMVPTTLGAKLALQDAATVKNMASSVPQYIYLIITAAAVFFIGVIGVTVYLHFWRGKSLLQKVAPDDEDFDRKSHGFMLQGGKGKVAPDDLQKEATSEWGLGGQKVAPLQFDSVLTVTEQPLRWQNGSMGSLFNRPHRFFSLPKLGLSSAAVSHDPTAAAVESPTTKQLTFLEQDEDRASSDLHSSSSSSCNSMVLDFLDHEFPHDEHGMIDIKIQRAQSPSDKSVVLPPFYIADPADGYNDYLKHIASHDAEVSMSEDDEEDSSSEDEESQGSYRDR